MIALLALCLAACAPSSADAPIPEQWRSIELEARAVGLGARSSGALAFRGGLVLSSSDSGFGGFSDIEVLDDGRLVAVSDAGQWFSARLVVNQEGALTGLAEPRLALMRNEQGEPFETKRAGDAEDLAQLPDGRFAVAFEQTQSIRLYDLNRDGPFGEARPGPVLGNVARLPSNSGLEALVSTADGALIVGAERSAAASTDLWFAPLHGGAPAQPAARYPLDFGFTLTALDRLPDGDLVALERFYAPVVGARIRLCRVSASNLAQGSVTKHEIGGLVSTQALDNFEGVSAVRLPNGGVRLYLIADDNFSRRQRTILYAFDVVGAPS